MRGPSSLIFLNALGELCTSEGVTGMVLLDIASDEYLLGLSDRVRTLYTITCNASIFSLSKEKSNFLIDDITYKAVKPPIQEDDAVVFVCIKQ